LAAAQRAALEPGARPECEDATVGLAPELPEASRQESREGRMEQWRAPQASEPRAREEQRASQPQAAQGRQVGPVWPEE